MIRVKNNNQLSIHEGQNTKQVLLSVVVSCKGLSVILKKNLVALSRQDLDRSVWEPCFLFKEEQKHSDCIGMIKDHFPSHRILFLPKDQPIYEMRNLVFQNTAYPYIYFIDEDVILEDSGHLSQLLALHKEYSKMTVIGGSYLDHPDSTFWGGSYNWVARIWTKQTGYSPAGNLSIKAKTVFKARFYSPNPFGFGGEEIHFLKSLHKEGHQSLWDKKLDAQHLALHSFRDFIKRAWIHGASLAFEKNTRKLSYLLFFKERASIVIKIAALFYLLLVRFSSFFYKMKSVVR